METGWIDKPVLHAIIIENALTRRVGRAEDTEREAVAGSFLSQNRLKTTSERLQNSTADTVIIK